MNKVELLTEPHLQFGDYFEHEDTKTGLAEYGPFGKNIDGLHPTEVRVGFIGTGHTVSLAKLWVERCSGFIESENIKTNRKAISKNLKEPKIVQDMLFAGLEEESEEITRRIEKILNRDFIGFNAESQFACRFVQNARWERTLDVRELQKILTIESKAQRIHTLVEHVDELLQSITSNSPSPDVVIIALTHDIDEKAFNARVGDVYLDFRRMLKARAMSHRNPVPTQLIKQATLEEKRELQEVSTRAWNFCTAQYYKADGIPWRPLTLRDDTCYVGISFYRSMEVSDKNVMRSSIAQAFDYLGQGLVLRGDPFEWDDRKMGKSPHLKTEMARDLMVRTLEEYRKLKGTLPKRVVVHKTSRFWGSEHPEHDEENGFYEGLDSVLKGIEVDLVALRSSNVCLVRQGLYPPVRGTYFSLDPNHHLVYTTGYIPYLETYPGTHVPRPLEIHQHLGGSDPRELCREVLGLTKMNVNNCAFTDGIPITLSFARSVGDIMKFIKEDMQAQVSYKYYM